MTLRLFQIWRHCGGSVGLKKTPTKASTQMLKKFRHYEISRLPRIGKSCAPSSAWLPSLAHLNQTRPASPATYASPSRKTQHGYGYQNINWPLTTQKLPSQARPCFNHLTRTSKLCFLETRQDYTALALPWSKSTKTDLPLYNVETQSRYSTVEIECLAIINTVTKCHYYLAGIKSFEVWTDHRLLIGAFDKHLDLLQNQRLMRMREKLTSYSFKVIWSPRKTHHIAEALSRAHLFRPCELTFEHEDINSCLRTNKSQYIKRWMIRGRSALHQKWKESKFHSRRIRHTSTEKL